MKRKKRKIMGSRKNWKMIKRKKMLNLEMKKLKKIQLKLKLI